MGGGGGPVNVPEEEIKQAFENGEDFTIGPNERTILTEDLEVPEGQTLTIEGTLDLGDGQTFTVTGNVNLDGGSITNQESNVTVKSGGELKGTNFGIKIDGTLLVEDGGTFTGSIEKNLEKATILEVDTLELAKGATFKFDSLDDYDEGVIIDWAIKSKIVLGTTLAVTGINPINININDEGTFEIGPDAKVNLTHSNINFGKNMDSIKIEGELNLKTNTEFLGNTGCQLNLNGNTLNVIGGTINGVVPEDKLEPYHLMSEGQINVVKKDDSMGGGQPGLIKGINRFIDAGMTIGDPELGPSDTSKIIVGNLNEDETKIIRNETVKFTENYEGNKITINNETVGGLLFVNQSITFNKDGSDVYFPNGSSTTVGPYEKYVDSNNPGFTINNPAGPPPQGLAVKFASVGATTNEKFYISM